MPQNLRGSVINLDQRLHPAIKSVDAGGGVPQVKHQLEEERFLLQEMLEKKTQEQIGALCHMNAAEVLPPPLPRC